MESQPRVLLIKGWDDLVRLQTVLGRTTNKDAERQRMARFGAPQRGSLNREFGALPHHTLRLHQLPDDLPQPRWDSVLRELSVGSVIIKRFKQPAPNQELILATFEEQGWPTKVDDPLPPHAALVSKQRLRATIRSMNHRQSRDLIHFFGDGTGTAIRWELS